MSKPFARLVGLKSLDTIANVWVNDLPGISAELVTHLSLDSDRIGSPADASDIRVMWEKVQRNALVKLEAEIRLELSKKGDYQPVLATLNVVAPTYYDVVVPTIPATYWTGLTIDVPYQGGTSLELQSLSVLARSAGSPRTLRIIDLTNGILLRESTWTLAPGLNTLELNLPLSALFLQPRRVAILLSNTDGSLVALPAPAWNDGRTGLNAISVATPTYSSDVPVLSALPGPLTLSAQWSRSIIDSLWPYVSDLAYAYALLCGSLLLTEKMGTPNLSLWTLSNRAFADRMEERYLTDARALIRVVARRMAQDWSLAQGSDTPALSDREDTPQLEDGSYV